VGGSLGERERAKTSDNDSAPAIIAPYNYLSNR
jgi:hypothetical protein